jgi:hypothetical protein
MTVSSFGIAARVSDKGGLSAFLNPTKNDRTKIPAMENNAPFLVIILMPPRYYFYRIHWLVSYMVDVSLVVRNTEKS